MSSIVIISGSPNKTSRLYGLIDAAEQTLKQAGHRVAIIHVAELPAEDLIHANFNSDSVKNVLEQIKEADAIIVASPVYKAAYTGILKTFLDLIPERGLAHKLTLPLFVGGTIAHLLAIDYALKPVLSALGARHILAGVYTVDQSIARRENGSFSLDEDAAGRLERALGELVHELEWKARRD